MTTTSQGNVDGVFFRNWYKNFTGEPIRTCGQTCMISRSILFHGGLPSQRCNSFLFNLLVSLEVLENTFYQSGNNTRLSEPLGPDHEMKHFSWIKVVMTFQVKCLNYMQLWGLQWLLQMAWSYFILLHNYNVRILNVCNLDVWADIISPHHHKHKSIKMWLSQLLHEDKKHPPRLLKVYQRSFWLWMTVGCM